MPSIFVTVGNAKQPFNRLVAAVDELARYGRLGFDVVVQHGHSTFELRSCRAIPFLAPAEFESLIASSEVVISHAGAGTLIQAITAGHVPVAVPRLKRFGELIDDHQLELATALEREGKVIAVTDVSQLEAAIAKARVGKRVRTAARPPLVDLVASVLKKFEEELG